jgi:DNA-binding response OmpR family regulator
MGSVRVPTVTVENSGDVQMIRSSGVQRQATALVFDDDSSRSTAHKRRLETEGYRVTTAADAATALSFAKQSTPDIIFVSAGGNGSGSSTFIQSLRSNDLTRHIRVTLLSNYYDRSLERLGLTAKEL